MTKRPPVSHSTQHEPAGTQPCTRRNRYPLVRACSRSPDAPSTNLVSVYIVPVSGMDAPLTVLSFGRCVNRPLQTVASAVKYCVKVTRLLADSCIRGTRQNDRDTCTRISPVLVERTTRCYSSSAQQLLRAKRAKGSHIRLSRLTSTNRTVTQKAAGPVVRRRSFRALKSLPMLTSSKKVPVRVSSCM